MTLRSAYTCSYADKPKENVTFRSQNYVTGSTVKSPYRRRYMYCTITICSVFKGLLDQPTDTNRIKYLFLHICFASVNAN